eukprot:tig00000237_g20495.t1
MYAHASRARAELVHPFMEIAYRSRLLAASEGPASPAKSTKRTRPSDIAGYSRVISSLLRNQKAARALEIFNEMRREGEVKPDAQAWGLLIRGLFDARMDAEARELLAAMDVPQPILFYNSVLSSLLKRSEPAEALTFWEEMRDRNAARGAELTPDGYTYSLLLTAYGRLGMVDMIEMARKEMEALGLPLNQKHLTSIMVGYARKGLVAEAQAVLREMDAKRMARDERAWNVLIDALCRGGQLERAFQVKEEMEGRAAETGDAGEGPSATTYAHLVNALARADDFDRIAALRAEMRERGVPHTLSLYNMLIDRMTRAGRVEEALAVKGEIEAAGLAPDIVTYTVAVAALGREGRLAEIEAVRGEMQARGVAPNVRFYNVLMNVYVRSNYPVLAEAAKEEMCAAGLKPDESTYNILISAFATSGLVDKALDLRDEMRRLGLRETVHTAEAMAKVKRIVYDRFAKRNPFMEEDEPFEILDFPRPAPSLFLRAALAPLRARVTCRPRRRIRAVLRARARGGAAASAPAAPPAALARHGARVWGR